MFLAGGATGTLWVYSAAGRRIASFQTGVAPSFVNDVAIAPNGAAYFTDSFSPFLYRLQADAQGVYRFEIWRDLRDTVIRYGPGFNLNGIAVSPDGRYLIVVQSNTGQLFRIATDTREVSEISLVGGDRATFGDGLLLSNQTLYVVRNQLNLIVRLRLTGDFSSGLERARPLAASSIAPPPVAMPRVKSAAWGQRSLVTQRPPHSGRFRDQDARCHATCRVGGSF